MQGSRLTTGLRMLREYVIAKYAQAVLSHTEALAPRKTATNTLIFNDNI